MSWTIFQIAPNRFDWLLAGFYSTARRIKLKNLVGSAIKMDEESPLSKPYSFAACAKSLANNELYSDISFLVGPEKEKIFGHKNILSLGSLVFHRMFYGSLKENNDQITIPDISSRGFVNILKYIYGHRLEEISLAELYETYVAGDKYLVHDLNDRLIEFIESRLDASNCCIIYNELVKIREHDELLDKAKRLIRSDAKVAFGNELFESIDKDTLIDLLNFQWLNVREIDILESCLRWVEAKIEKLGLIPTNENKREVFSAIKFHIRFSELSAKELGTFAGIESLLTNEEIGALLLHLFNKSTKSSPVNCKTARKSIRAFTADGEDCEYLAHSSSEFITLLNVNRKVLIKRLCTSLTVDVTNLALSIYKDDEKLEFDQRRLLDEEDHWFFEFDHLLELDAGSDYKVLFEFDHFEFDQDTQLSDLNKFVSVEDHHEFVFTFNFETLHCVKQIEFFGLV